MEHSLVELNAIVQDHIIRYLELPAQGFNVVQRFVYAALFFGTQRAWADHAKADGARQLSFSIGIRGNGSLPNVERRSEGTIGAKNGVPPYARGCKTLLLGVEHIPLHGILPIAW